MREVINYDRIDYNDYEIIEEQKYNEKYYTTRY